MKMYATQEEMIEKQIKKRGVKDPEVIRAMWEVDRALFVPAELQEKAYEDGPLPIGEDQTISQPYIVAYMAEQLQLNSEDIVLEVGTGCGYNAAVLSRIVKHVYSIEIIGWLTDLARKNLENAGIENVSTRNDDGYKGWPEKAPFDAIILNRRPGLYSWPSEETAKNRRKTTRPGRENEPETNIRSKEPEKKALRNEPCYW